MDKFLFSFLGGLYLTLNFIPAIHHHQRKVKKSKKRKEKTQIRTHPTAIACYVCVKKSFWLLAFSLQAFCPKPWYWDSDHGLTAAEIAACFETRHFFPPPFFFFLLCFYFWLAMAGYGWLPAYLFVPPTKPPPPIPAGHLLGYLGYLRYNKVYIYIQHA